MRNISEFWIDRSGKMIRVQILQHVLTLEDFCPKCSGGLRIVIGKIITTGDQVFRLECLICGWTSEALPDPKAL